MKPLIIANWKANKTIAETAAWVGKTKGELEQLNQVDVVVCSSFVCLPTLSTLMQDSIVRVGGQTVSDQKEGAFTGEVNAKMLKGLVTHCIVGHSERRKYYGEKEEQVGKKVENLVEENIIPILCISDLAQMDNYLAVSPSFKEHADKIVFVYEPPGAISGGGDYHPESPEEASKNAGSISEKLGKKVLTLYGGSVSEGDVDLFLKQEFLQGVLVGKASLDPTTFIELAKKAATVVV
ncbi:MAG TPA: triose-phosphate isomerase [Candidatus Saccharimonadales bacterium]|nr:triose-phosphate isomerase [Candidatus Saccharimonadales bacterium]